MNEGNLYPQLQLAALHTLFPLLSADLGNGRRALSSGGRGLRRRLRECQKSAIACNTKVLAARTSALQPERVSGEQIVIQHGFNPQIWGRPSRLVSPIKDPKLTRNLAFKPIFPHLHLFELWTYHLRNILSVQSGRTIHLPFINAPKQYDYVEAY